MGSPAPYHRHGTPRGRSVPGGRSQDSRRTGSGVRGGIAPARAGACCGHPSATPPMRGRAGPARSWATARTPPSIRVGPGTGGRGGNAIPLPRPWGQASPGAPPRGRRAQHHGERMAEPWSSPRLWLGCGGVSPRPSAAVAGGGGGRRACTLRGVSRRPPDPAARAACCPAPRAADGRAGGVPMGVCARSARAVTRRYSVPRRAVFPVTAGLPVGRSGAAAGCNAALQPHQRPGCRRRPPGVTPDSRGPCNAACARRSGWV